MTWQEHVYGGKRNVPQASNSSPEATQTAQERTNVENRGMISILAFSAATVRKARKRLYTMHKLGQSWYELGKLYNRPPGTIQHWANGRGKPDDDTIEAVLKTRLHYVTLVIATPRTRKPYYRPCLPKELGERIKQYNIDVEAVIEKAIEERKQANEAASESQL